MRTGRDRKKYSSPRAHSYTKHSMPGREGEKPITRNWTIGIVSLSPAIEENTNISSFSLPLFPHNNRPCFLIAPILCEREGEHKAFERCRRIIGPRDIAGFAFLSLSLSFRSRFCVFFYPRFFGAARARAPGRSLFVWSGK